MQAVYTIEMGVAGCACLLVGETPHAPMMSGPLKKKNKVYLCCIFALLRVSWHFAPQFLLLWVIFVITTGNNDLEKAQAIDIFSTFRKKVNM